MKWNQCALTALALLCLLPLAGKGENADYTVKSRRTAVEYHGETLDYQIDILNICGAKCYVTKVWMAEPARQIRKAISPWHQALDQAGHLAEQVPGAMLAINGSGYVSPVYPEIPDNYPGESADYFYTPLGSLTVVDGEVYRNLENAPYYGLTLEEDGLHMYAGAENREVLSRHPLQTWSFYEGCPLYAGGEELLDHDWAFARRRAVRTVISKLRQENTYLILTATNVNNNGLTLVQANAFLMNEYDPEWIYNLDGGPSSALLRRREGAKGLTLLYGAKQRIVDVMVFVE